MKQTTEQNIQKSIIDYLRLKKYVVFKHNSTQFGVRNGERFAFTNGTKGISDIIACSPRGGFVAIEVKKPGGKPTPEQIDFLERVSKNMGIGILAHSIDDVIGKVGESS